jgi:alpha-mannosidase
MGDRGRLVAPARLQPAGRRIVRRRANVGYNVDSFGHNGMLPQILKKSGLDYYVFMRPGEHEKALGYSLFWWESLDGSRVLAFRIPYSYNNYLGNKPGSVAEKTREVLQMATQAGHSFMNFYGVGNHGGGPTISNLRTVEALQREYGPETIVFSSPARYFEEVKSLGDKLPVLADDLQHHASGCYSAHSETKALSRKAEHRLMTAEKFCSLAHGVLALPYPAADLRRGWERVLFNHFHDIMGGCSLKEAYADVRDGFGEALNLAALSLNAAQQKISWAVDTMKEGIRFSSKETEWLVWEQNDLGFPVVIFNPLAWEVETPVQVNKGVASVTDDQGNILDFQLVRSTRTNAANNEDTLFTARLPAMGYRVYWLYRSKKLAPPPPSPRQLVAEDLSAENDWHRIEFDKHTGYIRSLIDKQSGKEVFRGKAAIPIIIDEQHCDTWAHGVTAFRDEIGRFGDAEVRLLEKGPVRARFRVTSRYNRSVLRQDFLLYRDKPGIEVRVMLDWREKHKMLKLSFPVNVTDPRATYEIPYGYIERPTNGEEEPGQQWVDVTGKSPDGGDSLFGVTLINDAKYSYDVKDSDLRMTVCRGAVFVDHYGKPDEYSEYMDQGIQEFRYELLPHQGDWRAAGAVKRAYELNVPPSFVIETYHKGPLPQRYAGLRVSNPSIIATVLKRAEDDNGYVLRLQETAGTAGETEIEIPMLKRRWSARLGKCEIKTFHIPDDPAGKVEEVDLIELAQ